MKGEIKMSGDKAQYVNEKELSQMIGLALPTLRNYRSLGKGPSYHKVGRAVRYALKDIESFMGQCRIEPQIEGRTNAPNNYNEGKTQK